jgi:hypothetical protein
MKTNDPSVRIVITQKGVKMVEFLGNRWEDEDVLHAVYEQVKPWVRAMDEALRQTKDDLENYLN